MRYVKDRMPNCINPDQMVASGVAFLLMIFRNSLDQDCLTFWYLCERFFCKLKTDRCTVHLQVYSELTSSQWTYKCTVNLQVNNLKVYSAIISTQWTYKYTVHLQIHSELKSVQWT